MKYIAYAACMLYTLYLAIIYNDPVFVVLLLIEIMFFIVNVVYLVYVVLNLKVSARFTMPAVSKDTKTHYEIALDNRGFLPIGKIQLDVHYRNLFYEIWNKLRIPAMADARKVTKLLTELKSQECGRLECDIKRFRVYDFFGLFYLSKRIRCKTWLSVLPDLYLIHLEEEENSLSAGEDTDLYDKEKSGDDPSEIFQIREYRPGDKLQRIHWKLSARTDDYMVKEYSRNIACSNVLFLDTCYDSKKERNMERFLETALALSNGWLEQERMHYIIWYYEEENRLERIQIKETEDLYQAMEQMLDIMTYKEEIRLEQLYEEQYGQKLPASVYQLDLHLIMSLDGKVIRRFSEDKIENFIGE